MRVVLTLSILLAVFAFSRAEYPELNDDSLTELERVRKFTRQKAVEHTKFWLYTKDTKEVNQGRQLSIGNRDLLHYLNFDTSLPVRFLIHGFLNKKNSPFNELITKAYLENHNVNVIVVDWGALSETAITAVKYFDVAESIKHVAELVAQMAKFLEKQGVPFEKMYLIGHSLGSHIAGMAGQNLKPSQFKVIYALDPAGPKFHDVAIHGRLDKDDAFYVETIQTDIVQVGNWLPEFLKRLVNNIVTFGFKGALGKASFFPNYGARQPGCDSGPCSHSRAYEYFAESLDSRYTFYGRGCNSFNDVLNKQCRGPERKAIMGGEPAHTDNRGVFYVQVGEVPPYSQNLKRKSRSWWQKAGDYISSWISG